jgi:hypothetical protein
MKKIFSYGGSIMENQRHVLANITLRGAVSQQVRPVFLTVPRLRHGIGSLGKTLLNHWRTSRCILFAALLVLLTTLVVVAYYLNHPKAEPLSDTWSYLFVVDRIQTHGQLVNFWRLPGYPLLIVLVYTLMGQGNLAVVSEVQALLFVLATLELYVLTALVLRRAWVAFLISVLVGANVPLLSYVKPIMSEAMALWLTVSLALAVIVFCIHCGHVHSGS